MSEMIQVEMPIAAAPRQVFQALTQADELTHWFAGHAAVSQAEGRYDFWGQLTPEAPTREQGQHRVLSWEDERSLAFVWPVRGAETKVTLTLEPQGQATLLRLAHEGLPPRQSGQSSFTDFWEYSLENLRGWVERRVVGARGDFTARMYGDVHLTVEIDAPRAAVFQALMMPEELDRYIASKAVIEPRVGGRYSFGWEGGGPIKILELEQDAKLAYAWKYEGEPDTVVTWTLENSGGGTRLMLVHAGFGAETWTEDYTCGWLHFLNRIKFLVEGGPSWQASRLLMQDHSAV